MIKDTKASCSNRKNAEIVLIDFCSRTNNMLFFIKLPNEKRLVKRTAAEIVLDTKLLRLLRHCDVWCACYVAGDEHATTVNKHIYKKSKRLKSKETAII